MGSRIDPTAPFHAGEARLQARLGLAERMDSIGRTVIRDHMPDQHRELFSQLPTLLLGVIDGQGQPWATMLAGAPGFVSSPDARHLTIDALPADTDPAAGWLAPQSPVGVLGLQPHTRRRNRMNGRVGARTATGFTVTVQQSFGNCPKYIQAREPLPRPIAPPRPAEPLGPQLDGAARALVARADTLFIASASGPHIGAARAEGVDVSHRGGLPGFVHLADEAGATQLTIPDYPGNAMFNTLGNLLQWPHAGLLFVDPDSGDMLQLAVQATLVLDGPAVARHPGAQRLLQARVAHGVWRPAALPLAWSAPRYAPQLLQPDFAPA